MAKIRVVGGDFVDHPESTYFWGSFTLYGWKQGQTKISAFVLSVDEHVVEVRLKSSNVVSPAGSATAGAARGAVLGLGGGPLGVVGGLVIGALLAGAVAQAQNEEARADRQRVEILFVDGRKLLAVADLRTVAGLQDKVMKARKKKPLTVSPAD